MLQKMNMILIDNQLLDSLTEQAKASPRLRMNLDLRNGSSDTSQRMLNAIEPGSVVTIHSHQKTSEAVVVLRGRVVEEFYDEFERISRLLMKYLLADRFVRLIFLPVLGILCVRWSPAL